MNKKLVIIGTGGHGNVIADNALKNGYTDIRFLDDHTVGDCMGFPIIGKIDDIEQLNDGETEFVIGIGKNEIRKAIAEKYDVNWATIVHPSAQIAVNVSIGKGTVIMAGSVVNTRSVIGKHCIINTGSVIEHDNVIEDYVHISPRVALGGTVQIGELSWIGIGATVQNNISICSDCTIGGGAVVVKEIHNSGVYVGVPAKEIGNSDVK